MAGTLARITANIGDPGERRRRMYVTIVMSVILYGAPIWTQTVARNRETLGSVRKLQRQLALRVIRGYRTVSHEAAAILSGMIPFDLAADRIRRAYLRRRDIIARDGVITPQVGGRCYSRLSGVARSHGGRGDSASYLRADRARSCEALLEGNWRRGLGGRMVPSHTA
ncbi:PREDICTED: uncharacterized protein LOC108767457 [Trachymyrmex cornetzi]|uniref:uncharacterized protein LOC108767457 n=1 Tax=Trachymyrmex cornetzi TaxID=471704 RepID=UPI00084F2B15|nr:PREDICTED: uncharacterized protein LOC108767457 [Trachymyrmex cornetzi]